MRLWYEREACAELEWRISPFVSEQTDRRTDEKKEDRDCYITYRVQMRVASHFGCARTMVPPRK